MRHLILFGLAICLAIAFASYADSGSTGSGGTCADPINYKDCAADCTNLQDCKECCGRGGFDDEFFNKCIDRCNAIWGVVS